MIYVWNGRDLQTTIKAHDAGFICALRFVDGKLYSGGKDGQVVITNTSTLSIEKKISFNNVLIRAIDVMAGKALVGLRDGTIFNVDLASGSKNAIMESHSDGEVWGLAPADENHVVTTGDDNKIKAWNVATRKCVVTGKVSSEVRKAPKGGASSLTELPDSQCSRAVAVNPTNGHVAIGHNDGTLTIRAGVTKLD